MLRFRPRSDTWLARSLPQQPANAPVDMQQARVRPHQHREAGEDEPADRTITTSPIVSASPVAASGFSGSTGTPSARGGRFRRPTAFAAARLGVGSASGVGGSAASHQGHEREDEESEDEDEKKWHRAGQHRVSLELGLETYVSSERHPPPGPKTGARRRPSRCLVESACRRTSSRRPRRRDRRPGRAHRQQAPVLASRRRSSSPGSFSVGRARSRHDARRTRVHELDRPDRRLRVGGRAARGVAGRTPHAVLERCLVIGSQHRRRLRHSGAGRRRVVIVAALREALAARRIRALGDRHRVGDVPHDGVLRRTATGRTSTRLEGLPVDASYPSGPRRPRARALLGLRAPPDVADDLDVG